MKYVTRFSVELDQETVVLDIFTANLNKKDQSEIEEFVDEWLDTGELQIFAHFNAPISSKKTAVIYVSTRKEELVSASEAANALQKLLGQPRCRCFRVGTESDPILYAQIGVWIRRYLDGVGLTLNSFDGECSPAMCDTLLDVARQIGQPTPINTIVCRVLEAIRRDDLSPILNLGENVSQTNA